MGETLDYVAMGKRIRQARKQRGLTQADAKIATPAPSARSFSTTLPEF